MSRKHRHIKPLIDNTQDEPKVREFLKRPRLDTPRPTSDDDQNVNFIFSQLSISNDPFDAIDIPVI